MSEIKAGSIRKGMYILFKDQPHQVTKTDFMSPGKGSAFMRLKLRNLVTGNAIEHTYKSNESVEEAAVETRQLEFSYAMGAEVVFMDNRTYEQVTVDADLVGEQLSLLISGLQVYVLFHDEVPIGISLPPKVNLKVIVADDAVAGNTVGKAMKEVEVETGYKVLAPLFIKIGDMISIDTTTGTYVSRVN